jgi:isopentenyl phosphate kinase
MGEIESFIVVKLGGSVITNKNEALSPNISNIQLICHELSTALHHDPKLKFFLIHGGGSFGHYYAKKFGISTDIARYTSEGIAKTSAGMIELHSMILKEMCDAGVFCETVLPAELVSGENLEISPTGEARIETMFANELFPITFGFVNLVPRGACIISGDSIALSLSKSLPVSKTIFLMDVDGVYPSFDRKGPIVTELNRKNFDVSSSLNRFDVTGGIKSKILTGFKIAACGSEVQFVNGTIEGRLSESLRGSSEVLATRIYPMKESTPQS